MDISTHPFADHPEIIALEDELFTSIDKVTEAWLDVRDSLVEALEEGITPHVLPDGRGRALAALGRIAGAEKQARIEIAAALATLSRNGDGTA